MLGYILETFVRRVPDACVLIVGAQEESDQVWSYADGDERLG